MKDKLSTPVEVARVMADTSCREGVLSKVVRSANPEHPESGRKRLRDTLAPKFRIFQGSSYPPAYHYDHGRFYPTGPFKRFCRRVVRDYEKN
jgi:hypothetical protein